MHQPIGSNSEPVSGHHPRHHLPALPHAGAGVRPSNVHMKTKGKCRQKPLIYDKAGLQLTHQRSTL